MGEYTCQHCGAQIKINFPISQSVMCIVDGKAYCRSCVEMIAKYFVDEAIL